MEDLRRELEERATDIAALERWHLDRIAVYRDKVNELEAKLYAEQESAKRGWEESGRRGDTIAAQAMELTALRARLAELERERDFHHDCFEGAERERKAAESRAQALTEALRRMVPDAHNWRSIRAQIDAALSESPAQPQPAGASEAESPLESLMLAGVASLRAFRKPPDAALPCDHRPGETHYGCELDPMMKGAALKCATCGDTGLVAAPGVLPKSAPLPCPTCKPTDPAPKCATCVPEAPFDFEGLTGALCFEHNGSKCNHCDLGYAAPSPGCPTCCPPTDPGPTGGAK